MAASFDTEEKGGKTFPFISRREVEALIAEGRSIIIVSQHALKVDSWVNYHPGGDKAIAHMVGRDATDEVTVLHSPEARRMMDRYRIGRIQGRWENFVPPIQGGKFRPASEVDGDLPDDNYYDNKIYTNGGPAAPDSEDSASSSSRSSQRSDSPLFDITDDGTSGLHTRQRASKLSRSASVSSVSSADEPESSQHPMDGMAYLDSETRKEIRLDLDKYPSLDTATQEGIVRKYRLLDARIKTEGLYNCNYGAYAIEVTRYTLLFSLMLLFLRWGWYATSAFFLGAFWHQLVFTAHDAGHMGITHSFQVDTVIGIIIANFLGGLSLGWWKRSHNVHHIVTNSPEHDPDIEYIPFMALSHRFLQSLRSTYHEKVMVYDGLAKRLVSIQAYLYYILLLFGRFNLYVLSFDFLFRGLSPKKGPARWHRTLEFAGQVFFWIWFGYGILYKTIPTGWDRFVFIMVSHMTTMPLHCQITLSHFAMSTADLGPAESFPQRMLRTTMDVDCPQWLDFFHGGLQFQAIHHLYPRIPRHNLRRTQKLVQEFCNEVGIPYALYGFVDGNKHVIGRLSDVSKQAAILAKCQKTLVESGDPFHSHH